MQQDIHSAEEAIGKIISFTMENGITSISLISNISQRVQYLSDIEVTPNNGLDTLYLKNVHLPNFVTDKVQMIAQIDISIFRYNFTKE